MSIQWSDFPSGQVGLYGTTRDFMLDGTPWVALSSGQIVADPDSATFPNGVVLRHYSGSGGADDSIRAALITPHQKAGVAHRFYVSNLPGAARPFLFFMTTGNSPIYGLRLRPNGGLELLYGLSTVIATADFPILFSNSWNHMEMVVDVVTGDIEVRKNGVAIPALTITHGSPPGGTVGIIAFCSGNAGDAAFPNFFTKDLVIYNGAGSEVNDFQGQVSVYDNVLDGDQSFNWIPSSGSTGYDLINEAPPDDADYIEADDAPPAASVFTLANLPDDVTTVRAVTTIVRTVKTDGGDGNIQVGITPNAGADYDDGPDTPVTTSETYYYSNSEISPDTSAPWTPAEVNAAWLRVNRTV